MDGASTPAEALAEELEGARRVIESHFLAAGDILSQSIEGIDALVGALDKLTKALDADAVAKTAADMRSAAKALLGLSENHGRRQNAVERLGGHRESLGRHVADMRSSLAYMRAFTVNIKIVSSGIAEAGHTFKAFAQEISDCIESGRGELREVEEEIVSLQEGLSGAQNEGRRLAGQLDTLLPALPNELDQSAVRIVEHYRKVHKVAEDVAAIARNIHMRVVRVLQALQIGDTTRQRIEHVQDALRDIMRSSDSRLAALGYALLDRELQASKLEFDTELGAIEDAMAEMADHSRDLLKLQDLAFGTEGKQSAGFLDELLARMEEALVVVRDIEGADSAALATGQRTAQAAEHLGTRINAIQSLKNDVQYMALNTTIKCAQIGEAARPLSVIAIELRDHGRHLETAAAAGLSELDGLTAAAGELSSPGEGKNGLSAAEALAFAARVIREGCERAQSETEVLVSKGEEVLSVLGKSVETLAFQDEIGGTLETVAGELSSLASRNPSDAQGLEDALSRLLAGFYHRYTMRQEREVHQAFVAWLGVPIADPEQLAPAA
ncbi:chemotaxis protein [Rhizomicrobium palustre]